MDTPPQRPAPDATSLKKFFVGKDITAVPRPAAILDRAKVQKHCSSMLDAAAALGVEFRPHVKSHKTVEAARLQIGNTSSHVNLVVSTLAELEYLSPFLKECRSNGRHVDALYGIPIPPSQCSRLARLGRELGEHAISVLVDNVSQLDTIDKLFHELGYPAGVFLKVDTGYHRAGLPPANIDKDGLLRRIMELESTGRARFIGFYAHSSLSYHNSTPDAAFDSLRSEIEGCIDALRHASRLLPKDKEFTLSVGATPQVVCTQHLTSATGRRSPAEKSLRAAIELVQAGKPSGFKTKLELHAGVYAIMDMQQISTNAKAEVDQFQSDIAMTVLTEVCSVYNNGERSRPEALLSVGALGLGREPCVHYKGWGVVKDPPALAATNPERRLVLNRVSQEHSIVAWEENGTEDVAQDLPPLPLEVGQVLQIYPNHACVAGAMFGWYLVVDSSDESHGSKIIDVWVRASGW